MLHRTAAAVPPMVHGTASAPLRTLGPGARHIVTSQSQALAPRYCDGAPIFGRGAAVSTASAICPRTTISRQPGYSLWGVAAGIGVVSTGSAMSHCDETEAGFKLHQVADDDPLLRKVPLGFRPVRGAHYIQYCEPLKGALGVPSSIHDQVVHETGTSVAVKQRQRDLLHSTLGAMVWRSVVPEQPEPRETAAFEDFAHFVRSPLQELLHPGKPANVHSPHPTSNAELAALLEYSPLEPIPEWSRARILALWGSLTEQEKQAPTIDRKRLQADKSVGALMGLAVNDALGAHLEFLHVRDGAHQDNFFCPYTGRVYGSYNSFNLKRGQWTDDTSMSLCLADSLIYTYHPDNHPNAKRRPYSGKDVRGRFYTWVDRSYNNAFRFDKGRESRTSIGLGGNVGSSLAAIDGIASMDDIPEVFESDVEDAGNGSIMRLAPVPIRFSAQVDLAVEVSAKQSLATHPGDAATSCAMFLGFLVSSLIRDTPLENARLRGHLEEQYGHRSELKTVQQRYVHSKVEEFLERYPEGALNADVRRMLSNPKDAGRTPHKETEALFDWRNPRPLLCKSYEAREKIGSYNERALAPGYFGAYSVDGLAIALHSVYHTETFVESTTKCVNFCGDADTTGAIAGQISGAFYGSAGIPAGLSDLTKSWDHGDIELRAAILHGMSVVESET